MISLNFSPLHAIGYDHTIYQDLLPSYLDQIHARKQGFYECIDDDNTIEKITQFADSIQGQYDDIVILGIGGSALGATTLRDSLGGQANQPNLSVIDNIDPGFIRAIENKLNYDRTLFIVITKSGGTPETLALYSYFADQVEQKKLNINQHFIFITDPETGFLREQAAALNVPNFSIPSNVGGRFSILTAVGLVPAALIGIDIQALIQGAQTMRDQFINPDFKHNMPFQLASAQFGLFIEGHTNAVMMPYVHQLKTFVSWYAQLLAESTGKRDIDDEETGITPISALGATDQHSLLQQFTQGLMDKQFCLIRTKNFSLELDIPPLPDHPKTTMLRDISFGQLMTAECQATIDTLAENNRPVYILEIDQINAQTLGAMFLLFEGATAFLGEFLEIDAFNQPGVERSKVLTREYLAAKKNN